MGQITDDRSRTVALYPLQRGRDPFGNVEVTEHRELQRRAGMKYAASGIGLVILIQQLVRMATNSGRVSWFEIVAVVAGIGVLALILYGRLGGMRSPPADPGTASSLLLGARRCASCGYSLAGLEPQPDGCTVCAECGAAWRLTTSGQSPNRGNPS